MWQGGEFRRHSLDLHANRLHIARYYALDVNMRVMGALSLQTPLSLLEGVKLCLEEAVLEDMPNISVAHSSAMPALQFLLLLVKALTIVSLERRVMQTSAEFFQSNNS